MIKTRDLTQDMEDHLVRDHIPEEDHPMEVEEDILLMKRDHHLPKKGDSHLIESLTVEKDIPMTENLITRIQVLDLINQVQVQIQVTEDLLNKY